MDTLVNRICSLAVSEPDKAAVCFKKETLSYRQLALAASRMAAALRNEGVAKGDRVCFSAVSKPETVAAYLAIHMAGAVAVFLDKNGTAANLASIYKTSEAVLMLTDKPMKEYGAECRILSLRKLYREAAQAEVSPDEEIDRAKISPDEEDLADMLFTSGTTGTPKGVMLTYRSVYNIFMNTARGVGITAEDVLLLPLPLHHSYALRVLRAVLYAGGTVVLQNGFTFARDVEANITDFGCNSMACVPSSFEMMKNQMREHLPVVLGKLRRIEFGSGSLTTAQRREITKLLPDTAICNTWGSSETGGAIFCDVNEAVKDETLITTIGKPLEGSVEVRVLDPDGRPMAESDAEHPGRMALRGGMEMAGYWKNPEKTNETLKDGWLLTGDMVYMERGYVFMLGRADDLINSGGEKVSPVEVENIASEYPGLRECACVGGDDPEGILGQIPVLFVAPKENYSESELTKFLSARMERYKLPRKYVLVDQIPRTRMLKIDRREMRKMLEEGDMRN